MAGGLIQLVAYGAQDIFLTHDPQITFFKMVYRRHTNFSTETIPQSFIHTPNFNKRVTCILSRNGDLIRNIHLSIILPIIPQFKDIYGNIDQVTKIAWVRRIGYAIINTVEIEIAGELIDRQYGDWMNIWHELTVRDQKNMDKILGNVKELIDPTNGKPSYQLFVPLYFWFNKYAGLALPVVSLQYDHIKINLELTSLEKCIIVTPNYSINISNDFVNFKPYEYLSQTVNGITSLAQFIYFDLTYRTLYIRRLTNNSFQSVTDNNPSNINTEQKQDAILFEQNPDGTYVNQAYFITGLSSGFEAMPRINSAESTYTNRSVNFSAITLTNAFLLVEYIFLDDEERVRFSQARHEYLIEQIFFNGEKTINGLNQSYNLGFNQPCKELIWVSQLALAQTLNDHFNYTDSVLRDDNNALIGTNIIQQETPIFNGKERVKFRDSQYFNWVQPYQNHTHSPSEGINVYSFSLHPENVSQPSGAANLSKIDSVFLKIIVSHKITFNNVAKLRVYGVFYNVLRIANGISGMVFSIDNQY